MAAPTPAPAGPGAEPPPPPERVKLHFKAVGSAPLLRKPKLTVNGTEPFHAVQTFLAKQLQLPQTERLFLYCDSAFSPVPTEPVGHLYACFGRGGELVVNYATTGAYG